MSLRRWSFRAVLVTAPLAFMGGLCGGADVAPSVIIPSTVWNNKDGTATVEVTSNPFALVIKDKQGNVLLETSNARSTTDPSDPMRAYAPLAVTHNTDLTTPVIMKGWDYYRGEDGPWTQVSRVTSINAAGDMLTVKLATGLAEPNVTLTITSQGIGLHLVASVDEGPKPNADTTINRVSMAFAMHPDDHFLGFGERFVYTDQRGKFLYSWVEDGGFGHGEGTPVGVGNPSPSGPAQTNVPIPWFWDPRGFGVLFNTTYRTRYHLGDDAPDAFRLEATESKLDVTVFADPDPMKLVGALTEVTGRPPEIADWLLAPRRRANIGTPEMTNLRAAHVPTTAIDTALHYFPGGIGNLTSTVKQITAEIHSHGFKAISYFCPFVSDAWHPVFDEAVAKGYLVKRPDGTPYVVLDPPYNAGMVDFTNPAAVKWYQGWLQQALDDGWDGWMYDFAEYVPLDAVMFDGTTGLEAHNKYPILYQQAAFDLLEKVRKKDYLIFVRSGYAGTGGRVPMVWAGDQNTDFSLSDGLPAALTGALNLGMSGVPFWGSDISGYHYIFNPPPDKDVYLRWTEVGAFSADMHDENEGAGNSPVSDRWQIWKDQQTLDIYKKYASMKTRMVPYTKVAAAQAHATGAPVMRHLSLLFPKDGKTYGIGDEYMLGDSLLIAPVVSRGAVTRDVYLPGDAYFDFWTGVRVGGHTTINAQAPLDAVPIYATMGAIVPLLAPDVETLIPATDGSGVVSAADRRDFVEVWIYAGNTTQFTLDDGAVISQSAPASAFSPGKPVAKNATLTVAATEKDLETCVACALDDPANHQLSISLKTSGDTITAGPLTVSLAQGPSVKRYLMRVRY